MCVDVLWKHIFCWVSMETCILHVPARPAGSHPREMPHVRPRASVGTSPSHPSSCIAPSPSLLVVSSGRWQR